MQADYEQFCLKTPISGNIGYRQKQGCNFFITPPGKKIVIFAFFWPFRVPDG